MWFTLIITGLLAAFFSTQNRYKWFYILYKTLPRDITALYRFVKLNAQMWIWSRHQKTVPKIFTDLVKKHPHKVMFSFENDVWTFAQVDEYSNKIGNYFASEGYRRGDTIALLMESRPEYVCFWLGLSKIGVVTALINNNLVADPLLHTINVANSKAVVFGSEHCDVIKNVLPSLKGTKLYQFHESPKAGKDVLEEAANVRIKLETALSTPLKELSEGKARDGLVYIYTSGTTGLPKAAVITNSRYAYFGAAPYYMANFQPNDVIYDPLPLYHSAGGMVGVGQAVLFGVPVVIRKKFSATNFWTDCVKYKCTVAQYIGEMCRYLLTVSKNAEPVKHNVRAIIGNGLRPQIWNKFIETFGVQEVFEFYGATEGISNLINIDNKAGAVGFVPRYADIFYPVTLIKCDDQTGEIIRNAEGFCTKCAPNETGVFIGRISKKKAWAAFSGYADKKATQKKIISNVFKNGDAYFNSGDILVQDEYGYYYFKDRTGDTFRWKGENVATSEVESVISNVVNLNDAVVFGVEIPGTEGKAGMAAIVDPNKSVDIDALAGGLKSNLPAYALPLFLRIMQSVPTTGTYKLKKIDLQAEGYDINKVTDDLYFFDVKTGKYVSLTKERYEAITNGTIRL